MVDWTLIAIFAGVIIVTHCIVLYVGYRIGIDVAKKREERKRTELLREKGSTIKAKVTDVNILTSQRRYIVKAKWYDNRTEKTHYFEDPFPFPKDATSRYHPKVKTGNMVEVLV